MPIKNKIQLITYPDSLGGNLKALDALLQAHLAAVCPGGVHILPPFPSSGDRGFAPLTYGEIDPAFGTWQDIHRIAAHSDIMVDLMVNHISRQSPYFQDFARRGRHSQYADLFITLDKVWPDGEPPQADIARIFLRKPGHPFSTITVRETGRPETIWTTFGKRDWSEQIDLDVRSPATRRLIAGYLGEFSRHQIKMVRLDAIGYVIKKAGTRCFMVEPEIYAFIDWMVEVAAGLGLEVLPEVHDRSATRLALARHGYWVYDFALPALILHTLFSASSTRLAAYLPGCPSRQFTMLDCHDGIPILPDVEGVLSASEAQQVVDLCLQRGANLSRILTPGETAAGLDAHQINCTYYSALACDDDAYLAARALQFFTPGVPQVYYVGLLAGENDSRAVTATGEGRAINRHNYSMAEVESVMRRPVVQRLLRLMRLRNAHPAFGGACRVLAPADTALAVEWRRDAALCRLEVDLRSRQATLTYSAENGSLVHDRI